MNQLTQRPISAMPSARNVRTYTDPVLRAFEKKLRWNGIRAAVLAGLATGFAVLAVAHTVLELATPAEPAPNRVQVEAARVSEPATVTAPVSPPVESEEFGLWIGPEPKKPSARRSRPKTNPLDVRK